MDRITDLAVETSAIQKERRTSGAFGIVKSELTLLSGDPCVTLSSPELHRNEEAARYTADALIKILASMLRGAERILVVGLGNGELACDRVGVLAAERIRPTRLTAKTGISLSVFVPRVTGKTGIDTFDAVCALAERIRPDALLAIDALAARAPGRIGTVFQVSAGGISPAAGIGADTAAIDRHTIGAPVVSIGVPTVIRAGVLAADLIDGVIEAKPRAFSDAAKNKILSKLTADAGSLIVTPKEIDVIAERCAAVIADAVNGYASRLPPRLS